MTQKDKLRLRLIDISELPKAGYIWNDTVSVEDLSNTQLGEVQAVAQASKAAYWQGSLLRQGDAFKLSARFECFVHSRCDRCMSEFEQTIAGQVERDYCRSEYSDVDDESSSIELLPASGKISLLDTLREELWLAVKPVVVCSESCKGMCQQCGENLNESTCKCDSDDQEHPFAALKNLKFE